MQGLYERKCLCEGKQGGSWKSWEHRQTTDKSDPEWRRDRSLLGCWARPHGNYPAKVSLPRNVRSPKSMAPLVRHPCCAQPRTRSSPWKAWVLHQHDLGSHRATADDGGQLHSLSMEGHCHGRQGRGLNSRGLYAAVLESAWQVNNGTDTEKPAHLPHCSESATAPFTLERWFPLNNSPIGRCNKRPSMSLPLRHLSFSFAL